MKNGALHPRRRPRRAQSRWRTRVAAAQRAGDGYALLFPKLAREGDPDFERWAPQILSALKGHRTVTLVGHSLGGAALLHRLTRRRVARVFAGLYLLARNRGQS